MKTSQNIIQKKSDSGEKLNRIFNRRDSTNILSEKLIEEKLNYVCIFGTCNKEFPNFCRWKLHYISHVSFYLKF